MAPILRFLVGFEDYIQATRGEGVHLWDERGHRYLDAGSSNFTACIGHAVPEVRAEMAAQLDTLTIHPPHCTSEPAEALARTLLDGAPSGWFSHVSFCNSGSEGIETAIKLARQHHVERGEMQRTRIIARRNGYHGFTLGALSATGHPTFRNSGGWDSMLAPFEHVASQDCDHCPFGRTYPGCGLDCATDLERMIEHVGPDRVAAFVAEPIGGALGGASSPPPEYWTEIRRICDEHGILLIADEVLTGCGRTGPRFAMQHWNVAPDLCVLGKGLAGGYAPLAAVLAHESVVAPLAEGSGRFASTGTFHRHPLSCAAGRAVQRYFDQHALGARAEEMGTLLANQLQELTTKHEDKVRFVRGKGLLWALELKTSASASSGFVGPDLQMLLGCRSRGVLVNIGVHPAHPRVLVAPPLVIEEPEIHTIVESIDFALSHLS